jgi:hypothetical protein
MLIIEERERKDVGLGTAIVREVVLENQQEPGVGLQSQVARHVRRIVDRASSCHPGIDHLPSEGWNWVTSFVGVLGWLDTPLPGWLVFSHLGDLSVGLVTSDRTAASPVLWQRAIALAIWFASAIVILLWQYLNWTAVGSPTVEGVQGRYFIAAAPLIYLVAYHPALQWPCRAWRLIVPAWAAAVGLVTIGVLLRRYWL